MPSYYWIKVYHEIIDDSKMALLPDRLWRRVMELFILAGRHNKDGVLPGARELAWELRMNADELEMDLHQIETTGMIRRTPDGWLVVNFKKRQAAATPAQRTRQARKRARKRDSNADETEMSRFVTQNRTDIDKDIDKRREEEEFSTSPPDEVNLHEDTLEKLKHGGVSINHRDALNIFSMVTGMVHVPGNDMSYVEKIRALADEHKEETVNYLRKFWERWTTSKTKNGRPYSRTNLGWIDWAIAGELPDTQIGNSIKIEIGQERQPYARA